MDFCTIIVVSASLMTVTTLLLSVLWKRKSLSLLNAHVMITGGSSGIGKQIAIEVAKQGANITIIARNQKRLDDAKEEIAKHLKDQSKQKILCLSEDIAADAENVQLAVNKAVSDLGPVRMLVNCAGFAISKTFEDLKPKDFKTMMDVNYLGTVYVTKAVIDSMKSCNEGRIIFISSQAGQIGLFGYTAYSPAKFALMGFGEALQMEIKPYNIYITIAFPPDTDTPGFAAEQDGKPEETLLISETAGLLQPDIVAKTILKDSLSGKFQSSMGMDGLLLASLTSGMSPVGTLCEAVIQIVTMSIFRLVSFFYLAMFDRIVSKCKTKRDLALNNKKKSS